MNYFKKDDYYCDSDFHFAMGCLAFVVVSVVVALCLSVYWFSGSGHPPGVRGTVSGAWHHAKCFIRLCDEDGRCPYWSSNQSRCYMLNEEGAKFLDHYENGK